MNYFLYLLSAVVVTVGIRVIPMMLLRKPITNKTVRSFLYYVPYVTFSAMIFPEIMNTIGNPVMGLILLAVGAVAAYAFENLFITVAAVTVLAMIMPFWNDIVVFLTTIVSK